EEPVEQDEEEDQRDHPGEQAEVRSRRAHLPQLGEELVDAHHSSAVNSRNTSSRDDDSWTSSCSTTPARSAISPTRPLEAPSTSSPSPSSDVRRTPSASSSRRSRSTSGERTRTAPPTRAVSAASGENVTSLPLLMIATWSTVCATSASTWLETRTVLPSA